MNYKFTITFWFSIIFTFGLFHAWDIFFVAFIKKQPNAKLYWMKHRFHYAEIKDDKYFSYNDLHRVYHKAYFNNKLNEL